MGIRDYGDKEVRDLSLGSIFHASRISPAVMLSTLLWKRHPERGYAMAKRFTFSLEQRNEKSSA